MKEVIMWTITENKKWFDLEQQFDWVKDMQNVPQDARHHAEGDVAIHTQMVLEALRNLPSFQSLGPQEKEILWTSALLHDVEKRSTTVTERDGSITAHGNARKGAMTARNILYRDLDSAPAFGLRENIVSLVRYHGLPIWLLDKPDPVRTIIKASMETNTQWLAMLARADAQGRICYDKPNLLYRIDCFEEFCREYGCWGQPRQFASPHARTIYLEKEDSSPDYVPYDQPETTVTLMSGLPGAGKDHYIKKHLSDQPVVSLDNIRIAMKASPTDSSANGQVIQAAKEQARSFLRAQKPFVWNGTNITRQMRAQLIDLFRQYRAHVRILYIEAPYRQLMRQNKEREAVVPANALERLIDKLEPPAPWEAHEVVYISAPA